MRGRAMQADAKRSEAPTSVRVAYHAGVCECRASASAASSSSLFAAWVTSYTTCLTDSSPKRTKGEICAEVSQSARKRCSFTSNARAASPCAKRLSA
eukprot:CAMPEP_0182582814 /NCGR_PEP_ID=MMETSP1324-20130603/53607_1 /TAXON_ID=236786 /ORGANISM="Florenciella sp., Strain RCC1587" /LENGTH=96 /DNA_ID=CAMNT_0024799317 /DNA_START=32 /DNA_END=317 /DNA_ORIENTATION=+